MGWQSIPYADYAQCLAGVSAPWELPPGLCFVYSPVRNAIPPGYAPPMGLYLFYQPKRGVLGYGGNMKKHCAALQKRRPSPFPRSG